MLRIFFGEADQWHDEPLYDAIVKKLRLMDIAGATVYRGILGYGAKGHEHKKSFLHVSRDLPIMLSVIDAPEKIRAASEVIEGMLEDGLLVISDVDMVRLVRNARLNPVGFSAYISRRGTALEANPCLRRLSPNAVSSRSRARQCFAAWKATGRRAICIARI